MQFIEFIATSNRKNSGNPHRARCARAIPSRAVHGWTEGVETRRWRGIARRNTPQASGAGNREEIVHAARTTCGVRVALVEEKWSAGPGCDEILSRHSRGGASGDPRRLKRECKTGGIPFKVTNTGTEVADEESA